MNTCVEVFKPLVKVLRLVDGDWRPSMGFIYGELVDAKKEIVKVCNGNLDLCNPILEIIDAKSKDRLDSPLHLARYISNPYYFYRDKDVENNEKCMDAMMACVEAFFPNDFDSQHEVVNIELLKYKKMEGYFGRKMAVVGRSKNDPDFDIVGWWSNYGGQTPKLTWMAKRILSSTTSSSGCERNWSAFEGVHTKKRSMLDSERLSNLVYVQFNAKLLNKNKRMKDKGDMLLANDSKRAQGWIVEGGDEEEDDGSSGISYEDVRELHEDDFKSDDEDVDVNSEDIVFEFEDSDKEMW